MAQLPLRIDEGDIIVVGYGRKQYSYSVEETGEHVFTIRDITGDRGSFEVDKYEISDMMNGGENFQIIR